MYDKPKWTLNSRRLLYSSKGVEVFESLILGRRNRFKAEFKAALENPHDSWLLAGWRFDDLSTVLWALESCVPEKTFLLNPIEHIDSILMGAAQSDYYYTYEKEY
jgi:hypothetical protein